MSTRSTLMALCAGLLLAVPAATLAEEPGLEPLPEPPPMPEDLSLQESLEPEVRIIYADDKVITQYVVEGVVRAVKVEHGDSDIPAYYLVDTDGDGRLDRRSGVSDEQERLLAHWIIASW